MAVNKTAHRNTPTGDLAQQFMAECHAIGDWWLTYAVDHENGGFWGEVSHDNTPNRSADKCVILNMRILWFFSEAAIVTGRQGYVDAARRAFNYLSAKFIDREHGGVLWMLDSQGELRDGRKHTYAQAFAIYALSAYCRLTGEAEALDLAAGLFDLLEQKARDREYGGYFEAYAQDWGPLTDVRLSEKEDNSPKTMNTHLHVLEAYTGLYEAVREAPERAEPVAAALADTLAVFCERIVDLSTGHVRMFMNEAWADHSHAYSFGHDIEASWLIHKAIKALEQSAYPAWQYMPHVERLAQVALRDGLTASGRMADEYDLLEKTFVRSAWWVQAEAMVGFANMWRLGHGESYREAALRIWQEVQQNYIDHEHGEWLWYAKTDLAPHLSEYKIGAWKAPYHNGRAMIMLSDLLA